MKSDVAVNGEFILLSRTAKHPGNFSRPPQISIWFVNDNFGKHETNIKMSIIQWIKELFKTSHQFQKHEIWLERSATRRKMSSLLLSSITVWRSKFQYFEVLDRFSKLSITICLEALRLLAVEVLSKNASEAYRTNMINPLSDHLQNFEINTRWMQSSMDRLWIVIKAENEMHPIGRQKELEIETDVTHYLKTISSIPATDLIVGRHVCNADETHFLTNVENIPAVSFSGQKNEKYMDVVGGRKVLNYGWLVYWWQSC